jgi:hypothetical protein
MKHALFVASLVLVAGSAVGCGGDSGGGGTSAPDNASSAEFCSAFGDLFTGIMAAGSGGTSDAIKALKAGANKLSDTGTPDGIPDAARHGFEVFVNAIEDLADDADLSELDNLGGGVSKGDEADVTAFVTWAVGECPDALGDLGGLPSDLPTDLPSDFPTDLPTDLPTSS